MGSIKVNDTLSVEWPADGSQVRVVRKDGGLVVLGLDEVRAVVSALAEAAARAAAAASGEEHQDDLY